MNWIELFIYTWPIRTLLMFWICGWAVKTVRGKKVVAACQAPAIIQWNMHIQPDYENNAREEWAHHYWHEHGGG